MVAIPHWLLRFLDISMYPFIPQSVPQEFLTSQKAVPAVNTPSNGEDSVVELRSRACWLVVDSRAVELEGVLRSIDGNGGWSSANLDLEVALRSRVNVNEALKGGTAVGSVVVAGSVLSGVWVA